MEVNYKVVVNDTYDFNITESEIHKFDAITSNTSTHVLHNHLSTSVQVLHKDFLKRSYTVKVNGNRYTIHIENELDALITHMGLSLGEDSVRNEILAPMPGLIIEVNVAKGQEVKQGDFLCVLEAMKMENTLLSPRDGIIKTAKISVGQTVDKGELLIEFEL
jgi:acetyl/propionyl-CoA carboxylase alpha subunit